MFGPLRHSYPKGDSPYRKVLLEYKRIKKKIIYRGLRYTYVLWHYNKTSSKCDDVGDTHSS